MTHALQSYSEGRWQDGMGEQRPLLDAATGEVVATIPARGPDVAAMVGHARLGQRDEVRQAVARLAAATRPVFGDTDKVTVAGADAERGAFLSPILLRGDGVSAAPVHEIEAFGPVSTLLPYEGLDQVAEAAALGEGSLVGSIVSGDSGVVRDLIGRLAPWHGRILVLDRTDAAESTGHGVAMPQMLHGGPGRAGGGEELGGLRAVRHYLQRTAVQGHPDLLAALVPEGSEGER